jgi:hypothetical protein
LESVQPVYAYFFTPHVESNFDFRNHRRITMSDKLVIGLPRHHLDLSLRCTPQNYRAEPPFTEIMMTILQILESLSCELVSLLRGVFRVLSFLLRSDMGPFLEVVATISYMGDFGTFSADFSRNRLLLLRNINIPRQRSFFGMV